MADEVEISNVGGENGVASEATLASLLRAMERMSGAAGSNSSDAARAARRLRDAQRDAAGSTEDNTDARDENTEAIESASEATGRLARAIVEVTGNLIGVLASSVVDLGSVLLSSKTQLSDFAEKLPFIGGILGSLVGILDDSIATFRQLSSVGAAFGNSIEDMRLSATQLELGLDEMASFVSSNSEALRLLSGTVTDGVNRFKAINKTIKDTGDFAALKNLGFTVEEINEGMADYTALQARLGRLQRMDSRQIANGSARYLEQLDRLAKVTGQSRKELAASMLQQSQDAAFRALQNNLSGDAAENFRSSMALIDTLPESVANGLKDLADGIPQTAEGIALLTTIGPEIQSAMKSVAKGADPQVLIEAIGAAGHDIEKFVGGSADQQAAIIAQFRQTQPEIAAVLDAATKMKNFGTKEMSAARAEQAKRAETTATLTEFDDTLRTFRATIAKAFIKSGIFEKMAGGVASVADLLEKTLASDEFAASLKNISSKIKEFLTDIQDVGIKEAFKNLFKEDGPFAGLGTMISDVIKSALKETLPMIGVGLVALFGGVYLAKKISSAFTGLLGGLLGGGGGGDDDGPDRGGRRGRRGGAGRGLGGFLGNLGGGIMKGAAAGLKAFANPKVVLGAVNLGLVIAAIGAGIAGAAWITSKAMPSFAAGMKSFEDLDGGALKEAGKGMLLVSAGMASFGAASVISGVGSLVGSIFEGLNGFFDGDSPLEKLKKFAVPGINLKTIENNASALIVFGNALRSFDGGSGSVAWADMFDFGDTPLEKLEQFSGGKVEPMNVVRNAQALKVLGNALQSFDGSASSTSWTDMFDFGDSPLEKLEQFSGGKVDAEKVNANAKALTALASGLMSMSSSTSSNLEISDDLIDSLEELGDLSSSDLENTARGMQAIANVSGLKANLDVLNSGLDSKSLKTYTDTMEDLVAALKEMNSELSKDNKVGFGKGTNAGDVLSKASGSTSTSTDGMEKLNNLMQNMLMVLTKIQEDTTKTEKNTKSLGGGDIANGYVSKIR